MGPYYIWQMNDGRWQISVLTSVPAKDAEASLRLWRAGLDRGYDTRAAAEGALRQWLQPATEPTEQGNQYVIPGCEKDKSRGPAQMGFF